MKVNFLILISITALVLFSLLSPAQKPLKDIEEFKSRFAAGSKNMNSIESSFVQEKNLTMLSEKIITKGKFYFKRENKLRWEYTDPFAYLFILNNGKIYIRDESKENRFDARTGSMFGEINNILIGSVQGTLLNDQKNFTTSFFETITAYIAHLKPRSSKLSGYLSEIVITFDKKDLSVTRLEMIEPGGDFTKIDFIGKKLNTLTNEDKFIIP